MTNLAKRSNRQINLTFFLCFILLGALRCSEDEKSEKFVAKVDDAVLTEEQINSALSDKRNDGKLRSEFIQNWIEREILFKEAAKDGILEEKEFNLIIDQSRKELATSMFINKLMDQGNNEVSDSEILQYFESNKDDFKLKDDLFRVNIACFDNFDNAVKFRNTVVETSWKNALFSSQNDSLISAVKPDRFIYRYQLYPLNFVRGVSSLQKDEVSLVIETEPDKFAVVQLIEKLDKDIIAPLEVVKEDVKARILMIKKKEILKKYIDKLIADHNPEIKRYSE